LGEPLVEHLDMIGLLAGGHGDIEFTNPSGLTCDGAGDLVIADTGNHRIVKLDGEGNLLWSLGSRDVRGAPCPGTAQGEFRSPQAVCTDSEANIYVADSGNCRVQKLSPDGEPKTAFGSWGNDYGQFGGDGPIGIAVDEKGHVLVADSHTVLGGNHKVERFDSEGDYLGQFGGYGVGLGQFAGSVPIREYGLDFGPGIGPGPIGPMGIAIDSEPGLLLDRNNLGGDIYVADCDNDRIVSFRGTGEPMRTLGASALHRPRQLAIDSAGRLYASGVHKHEPPAEVQDINDPFRWRIEPECRWVSVLDRTGAIVAKIGTREAHDQMSHQVGRGSHSHGYGLAISQVDESIVYVQGGNVIFKFRLDWGA
jgi:DNA-binding beta-propeller fold protein YncE